MERTKYLLSEEEIPTSWYNIMADIPRPPDPPLHPGTKQLIGPGDLAAIFPMPLIEQEVSTQRWIDIPDEVLDAYSLWRPTPLFRAHRLEAELGTPARIYYKYEGVSPAGSHKPNTAVAQAYYNKQAGVKRLATETGAGQWGSALALACRMFGLACTVYMVKVSYEQKPYRRIMMQTWGAEVIASPSMRTNAGRGILAQAPDSLGSLGIAISEAVEDAASHAGTNYSLGSVLNHVLLHQTVIGLEAKKQMDQAEDYPDVVIGSHGGGSNFAGLAFPFLQDKINGRETRFILGHSFAPPGIHAGGLRYHGAAPLVSRLYEDGLIEAKAVNQTRVFEAAITFARTEGIIPAPESAHAVRVAMDEALQAREAGEERVILFGLSGHGHFDMAAYDAFLHGQLQDYEYPREAVESSLRAIGVLQP